MCTVVFLILQFFNNLSCQVGAFAQDFLNSVKGTEDANKILSNDAACPICDQVLSKRSVLKHSLMKPVDINPNDECINMAMAGISPQICIWGATESPFSTAMVAAYILYASLVMKSAYRSVMFFMGQKELEMQFKANKIVSQCRQKCEVLQEKFTEKMEQVHTAYQKMAKRCQTLEQEVESLSKDKQELQEKFSEKSRQKRKLDEMYDQLRSEYESMKQSASQPARNFYSTTEPDLFSNPPSMMDNRDSIRKDWSVFTPETPVRREDIWPQPRQNTSNSGPFDISGGSPAKPSAIPLDTGNRRAPARPAFGGGASNASMTLRNLILSPIKRPQLSRNRPQMFT
ncbi:hypothetical protein RHSIM_RhsimUnG0206700 [Rhododendron simsii]|uniref:E3 ubiquitin-protein ligase CCNB1IP1 homolog n=1 Tax=Rhododendron simsii TaxID=118357 RepID=A0A834FTI0_RHOSS|nr:hypothetical protein RHSIM_RhsimUnG0206700 [Rhododendron simsii]